MPRSAPSLCSACPVIAATYESGSQGHCEKYLDHNRAGRAPQARKTRLAVCQSFRICMLELVILPAFVLILRFLGRGSGVWHGLRSAVVFSAKKNQMHVQGPNFPQGLAPIWRSRPGPSQRGGRAKKCSNFCYNITFAKNCLILGFFFITTEDTYFG